jgi:hypothetical protein
MQWLNLLSAFCDELLMFLEIIPNDQDTHSMTNVPKYITDNPKFSTLCMSSHVNSPICKYNNSDPPSQECIEKIQMVYAQARYTFKRISKHLSIGKFRPNQPPLFFDKAMWVCLTLGVQHMDICSKYGTSEIHTGSHSHNHSPVHFKDIA